MRFLTPLLYSHQFESASEKSANVDSDRDYDFDLEDLMQMSDDDSFSTQKHDKASDVQFDMLKHDPVFMEAQETCYVCLEEVVIGDRDTVRPFNDEDPGHKHLLHAQCLQDLIDRGISQRIRTIIHM